MAGRTESCACSLMDRARDSGFRGWRFESSQARRKWGLIPHRKKSDCLTIYKVPNIPGTRNFSTLAITGSFKGFDVISEV